MSGSLPADVILEARVGVGPVAGRRRISLGSDAIISVTVLDSQTRKPLAGATGQSALYWLPGTVGDLSVAQPLVPIEAAPGDWRMTVPGRIPGSHVTWFSIERPVRKTVVLVFDVGSAGQLSLTGTRTIPWSNIEAVAAAAGASAALAEIGQITAEHVRAAVAEAVAAAVQEIGEAAAKAATAAVAAQLDDKATKESVEALGKEVDAKADADAIDEVLTRLSERIAGLEGAGPVAPQLTALAIAKAFGAPVFDFSEPRNSALLTL
jgi:uncharacterized protein (DUF433 family)